MATALTGCKFCGQPDPDGTDVCESCVRRYLRCGGCGYTNVEYRTGRLNTIVLQGTWRGMPADCLSCGATVINKKIKAVGLLQEDLVKLSDGDSFIRRRLCKISN